MYTGKGFKYSELGDIDIIKHGAFYHLFHLILPNHDYIAHAVSRDGFIWRRVKNALYIGEPGDWDDDMLWTMHVTTDPDIEGQWRMFYTGLSRKENGRIQRIGLATSSDLFHWEKVRTPGYPLSLNTPVYETAISESRLWVSCRDPFFYMEEDQRLLLVSARVSHGPNIRRGCVGMGREVKPGHFVWEDPLFHPRMYDDIEVPGLIKLDDKYYLIGNIREDIKVHYWISESLFGNFKAYSDNVLLPQGNYAARFTKEENHYLIWNFFIGGNGQSVMRILPPPALLFVKDNGALGLTSYTKFDDKVISKMAWAQIQSVKQMLANPTAEVLSQSNTLSLKTESGCEIFILDTPGSSSDFRLKCRPTMIFPGKVGIVFRMDQETNGYFLSLDFIKGLAQARVWGTKEDGDFEYAFNFREIQANTFTTSSNLQYTLEIIAYGGYIEMSVNEEIILRFVDTTYFESGHVGFYVESAMILIENMTMEYFDGPQEEDHQVI